MGLPGGQEESQRIAQGIDHGMDFGAQSAFAAPDRLRVATTAMCEMTLVKIRGSCRKTTAFLSQACNVMLT
jgi:hypothetical protein